MTAFQPESLSKRPRPMDFDTYFDRLVLREGDWLRPAKQKLKPYWPQVAPELDRAAVELYQEVLGEPSDDWLRDIDAWLYSANHELDNRRPIDLVASREGVLSVRACFVRMSAGLIG